MKDETDAQITPPHAEDTRPELPRRDVEWQAHLAGSAAKQEALKGADPATENAPLLHAVTGGVMIMGQRVPCLDSVTLLLLEEAGRRMEADEEWRWLGGWAYSMLTLVWITLEPDHAWKCFDGNHPDDARTCMRELSGAIPVPELREFQTWFRARLAELKGEAPVPKR